MVIAFVAFVALMVAVGVRFGVRMVRAFREANARIVADIAFYRAFPSGMEEGE